MKHVDRQYPALQYVLVGIIALMVGGLLWYVTDVRRSSEELLRQANQATNQAQPKAAPTIDEADAIDSESAQWLAYKSPDNLFSVRLASGYIYEQGESMDGQTQLVVPNFAAAPTSQKATVTTVGTMPEGYRESLKMTAVPNRPEVLPFEGKMIRQFDTSSGLTGNIYLYTETKTLSPDEEGYMPRGAKTYTFEIKGKKTIFFSTYSTRASSSDRSALVEKMMKTVNIR